jgi:hypothetical protein
MCKFLHDVCSRGINPFNISWKRVAAERYIYVRNDLVIILVILSP